MLTCWESWKKRKMVITVTCQCMYHLNLCMFFCLHCKGGKWQLYYPGLFYNICCWCVFIALLVPSNFLFLFTSSIFVVTVGLWLVYLQPAMMALKRYLWFTIEKRKEFQIDYDCNFSIVIHREDCIISMRSKHGWLPRNVHNGLVIILDIDHI